MRNCAKLLCVLLLSSIGAARADDNSAGITLTALDGKTVRLTAGELRALPQTEVEGIDHDGKKSKYSGVALRALLDRADVPAGEKLRGEWMKRFVAIDATDKYAAVFALAELDPGFSDRVIILANAKNGRPLDARDAPFQVIVPSEKKRARCVRMVSGLRVLEIPPATK